MAAFSPHWFKDWELDSETWKQILSRDEYQIPVMTKEIIRVHCKNIQRINQQQFGILLPYWYTEEEKQRKKRFYKDYEDLEQRVLNEAGKTDWNGVEKMLEEISNEMLKIQNRARKRWKEEDVPGRIKAVRTWWDRDSCNENREPKRKIQINVETIERKIYVISDVTTHDSVSDLKSKICSEQIGTLPADIILAFQQNELIDDKTLESYGITNGATVNVVPRVSGKGLMGSAQFILNKAKLVFQCLVDWIPGLLKDSSRVLTDIDLVKIAQGIGKGWEILGLSLGLDRVQLDHITDENNSTVMKISTMLTTWLGEKGSEATVGTLYQTMTDCKGVRFNWTKLKSVFSDVC